MRRTVLEWQQQPTAANRRLNDDDAYDGGGRRVSGGDSRRATWKATSHVAAGKSELLAELFGGEDDFVSFRSEWHFVSFYPA
jgi:hypothetical protein